MLGLRRYCAMSVPYRIINRRILRHSIYVIIPQMYLHGVITQHLNPIFNFAGITLGLYVQKTQGKKT